MTEIVQCWACGVYNSGFPQGTCLLPLLLHLLPTPQLNTALDRWTSSQPVYVLGLSQNLYLACTIFLVEHVHSPVSHFVWALPIFKALGSWKSCHFRSTEESIVVLARKEGQFRRNMWKLMRNMGRKSSGRRDRGSSIYDLRRQVRATRGSLQLSMGENLQAVLEIQTWIGLTWTVSSLWSDTNCVHQGVISWGWWRWNIGSVYKSLYFNDYSSMTPTAPWTLRSKVF